MSELSCLLSLLGINLHMPLNQSSLLQISYAKEDLSHPEIRVDFILAERMYLKDNKSIFYFFKFSGVINPKLCINVFTFYYSQIY